MKDFSFLIGKDSYGRACLPDISYQSDPPVETVYPRITHQGDESFVYFNKRKISLVDFLNRCASGETKDLGHIGAYRASGVQTSISFNKRFRIQISDRFQAVIESFRNANPPLKTEIKESDPIGIVIEGDVGIANDATTNDKDWSLTLVSPEEDERRREKQAENGKLGEELAVLFEKQRLRNLDCPNPEKFINHIAKTNTNAGFDILSKWNGESRYIEVKASENGSNEFFISENEVRQLTRFKADGWLYFINLGERDAPDFGVMPLRDPGDKFEKVSNSTFNQESEGRIGVKIMLTSTQYRARLTE